MCQGAWEEFCPPMHWILGIQTLVLAVNPEVAHELAPASQGYSLAFLGNTDLYSHPRARAFVDI